MTTKGTCAGCGTRLTRVKMAAHLLDCPGANGTPGALLAVTPDRYGSRSYWLYLSTGAGATLRDLDQTLRELWFGGWHLSGFDIGELCYGETPDGDICGHEDLSATIAALIAPGRQALYTYDFGTSSHIEIQNLGPLAHSSDKPVFLLARNEPPTGRCRVCGARTTLICEECPWRSPHVCERCAPTHQRGHSLPAAAPNSPRRSDD